MRRKLRDLTFAAAGAAVMAVVFYTALPARKGRRRAPRIPRVANGKPDLNGIWQAMNTANWDLEPHMARPALAMRPGPIVPVPAKEVLAFGAVGAVPGGLGVVEGGEIPYTPEGPQEERGEPGELAARAIPRSSATCPGVPRATYMPFPFQIFQSDKAVAIAYEYAGAFRNIYLKDPGPPQVDCLDGAVGRALGRRHVRRRRQRLPRSELVRSRGQSSQRSAEGHRALHDDRSPITFSYEATIEDPKTFTRPWKISMPLYRRVEAGARLGQFKCVEFVEELMYGHLRKEPVK